MQKVKKLIGSTKFYVYLGNPAENIPIEIRIDGNTFYRVELGKKIKIGGMYETVQLLHRYDARLAAKKGNRLKAYQFFFSKKDALNLLKEGYSVISVETLSTLSFDDEYNQILSSNGKLLGEGSLPCGSYCLAINEPRLSKTYNEVKAQKLFAKVAEDQRKKKEKEERECEARREVASKLFEQRRNKEEISESVPQPEPVEDNSSSDIFLKVVGVAAIFLGGLSLGIYIKN